MISLGLVIKGENRNGSFKWEERKEEVEVEVEVCRHVVCFLVRRIFKQSAYQFTPSLCDGRIEVNIMEMQGACYCYSWPFTTVRIY